MRRRRAFSLLAACLLAACDSGDGSDRRHVTSTGVIQRSYVAIPEGSVPRGALALAQELAPPGPAVTPALLARGRERFEIFCTPCHGRSGRGDGTVVSRGFPRPPSYYEERLRAAPAEHIVSVITSGIGKMASYAERVPPHDRWAIAAHVKALQAAEGRSEATPAPPPGGAAAQ